MSDALVFLVLLAAPSQGDAPARPRGYAALRSEYDADLARWHRTYGSINVDSNRPEVIFQYAEWPAWDYAPKFLAIAEADPASDEAMRALLWIGCLGGGAADPADEAFYRVHSRAMNLIAAHHLDDPRLKAQLPNLMFARLTPAWERLFRKLSSEAEDRDVRGLATLALGRMLAAKVGAKRDPWYDRPAMSAFDSFRRERLAPEVREFVAKTDEAAARAESLKLLEIAEEQYGDVPYGTVQLARFARSARGEVPPAEPPKPAK